MTNQPDEEVLRSLAQKLKEVTERATERGVVALLPEINDVVALIQEFLDATEEEKQAP